MEMLPFGVEVIVQPGQVKTPIHDKMISGIDTEDAGQDGTYEPLIKCVDRINRRRCGLTD